MGSRKKASSELAIAVLRTGGRQFDVDACLKRFPKLRPNSIWHRGDALLRNRMRDNGFAATIAESNSLDKALERLGRVLESPAVRRLFKYLSTHGASSEIDISLEVGSREFFVNSITFTPAFLAKVVRVGVDLRVTGYPTR